MRLMIYLWTAIVVYRFIKLMLGGNYGTTGNIICDFLVLAYIALGMYYSVLDEDLLGIFVHTIISLGLLWISWLMTKGDMREGVIKNNELAIALVQIVDYCKRNAAALCGAGIITMIVFTALMANEKANKSTGPLSYNTTPTNKQSETQSSHNSGDVKRYTDRIPFAGMDEEDINKTAAGPYTKKEKNNGWTYYYWCIGDYTVLTVRVSETIDYQMSYSYDSTIKLHNVVSEVKQEFINVAWSSESNYLPYRIRERKYEYAFLKMPKFGPYYDGKKVTESDINQYLTNQRNNNRSSNSSSSYDYDDPDGYGYYDDFEDFYNDHFDDFDSYEEAEDYYDCYY